VLHRQKANQLCLSDWTTLTLGEAKKGHKLDERVNWLSDWNIAKINASPDGYHHDTYWLQICVLRESSSVVSNLMLSMACILALSFTAFGLHVEELADREMTAMTMLLATMTFKFLLADYLPSVPYLTVMDKYVVYGLLTISCQGVSFPFIDLVNSYSKEITAACGLHSPAAKLDNAICAVLLLWQLWVHGWMISLCWSTTMEKFISNGPPLQCVIHSRKKKSHNEMAKNLKHAEATDMFWYSSNDIYCPFPLPPEAERCTAQL